MSRQHDGTTGPGLASVRNVTQVRIRREAAEQTAAKILDSVLKEHEGSTSGRQVARLWDCNESLVRLWRDGARDAPMAIAFVLPPSVATELLRACIAEVELLSSGLPVDRAHRQIVARVGTLSTDLDAGLADGVLSEDERRQLASSLRQIALRCDQAARDLAVGE